MLCSPLTPVALILEHCAIVEIARHNLRIDPPLVTILALIASIRFDQLSMEALHTI